MLNPVSPQVDNSSQISSPASPVVAASQPAAPVPKVSISNVQGEIQDDGGMDITGIIQNLSDTSLNGVTVNFSYFDDDGNKVDDAMDFIQTLAPDDTWSFKVSSLKDSCKKYRLDSITSFIDNSEVNLDVQQTQ
ncbi:MAG TPA: FxLYD domain-containing protein [Candidatus Aquilonibacter sp.]|nr:FxLYD domain-containing protein [Candidatus Aquilonibacter sp.]